MMGSRGSSLIAENKERQRLLFRIEELSKNQLHGKAHWLYDAEFDFHMPCCSRMKKYEWGTWYCGNGPLEGDRILSGDCGEHND